MDLGVVNYYLPRTGATAAALEGPEEIIFETPETAKKALEQGKADKLLYLKGDTKGGQEEKILTLLLYLLERYRF